MKHQIEQLLAAFERVNCPEPHMMDNGNGTSVYVATRVSSIVLSRGNHDAIRVRLSIKQIVEFPGE